MLEQHATGAPTFESDGAVGRDHRARVETGERDIGHRRDIERCAAGNDAFERVPELETQEAGPESLAQRVEDGEPLRALRDHGLDGLDADDRCISGPDRDGARTPRDLARGGRRRRGRIGSPGHGTAAARPRARRNRDPPSVRWMDREPPLRVVMRAFAGRIGLALLLCFAVVGAGVVAVNRTIDDAVAQIPRIAVTTAPVGSHGVNYLIVGSDSRAFVEDGTDQAAFGSESDTGPARSDTLMVLHTEGDQAYAVSFPRDLWVEIPGKGMSKINSAYNDGPQKVVDMLKADFDLDINHYLEVNFVAFERLVDAIGTVGVYFPAPTRDFDTAQQGDTSFFVEAPGCVQLTGRPCAPVRAGAPHAAARSHDQQVGVGRPDP